MTRLHKNNILSGGKSSWWHHGWQYCLSNQNCVTSLGWRLTWAGYCTCFHTSYVEKKMNICLVFILNVEISNPPPTHFSVEVHSFFYFWRVWNENQMKKNFLLLKANIRKNLFYFCLSLFLLFPTVIAIIFSPWCFFSPLNKYVCFYSFNLIMYPSPQKIWAKLFLMMLKVMILLSFLKRSMEMQSMFVATVNIPEAGVFPDTQERLSGS